MNIQQVQDHIAALAPVVGLARERALAPLAKDYHMPHYLRVRDKLDYARERLRYLRAKRAGNA